MMTLTKGDLFSDGLRMALTKVASCNGLYTKVAYSYMRLLKILEKELKSANLQKIEILKKYVNVSVEDPSKFQLNETKTDFLFKYGVDAAAAKKELEDFAGQEVTIDRDKFEVEKMEPAKLTPSEIGTLEFMFNQPSEEV